MLKALRWFLSACYGNPEILAALETMYREPFPHLNLRQWSGVIYTWLTQLVLDPTRSDRVTMDYLMKLVTTALEWSYVAGDTGVAAETLEKAAELLVLRRTTLRLIDGAGPSVEAPPSESTVEAQVSEAKAEHVSSSSDLPENPTQAPSAHNTYEISRNAVETRSNPPNRLNARFLRWFPLTSRVFEKVL